jgi:hypothetical protein
VTGGTAVTLYSGGVIAISWGADGIVVVRAMGTEQRGPSEPGILRVSPRGGQPEVLVPIANDEYAMGRPEVVANGEVVLFTRLTRAAIGGNRWEESAQIVAQSIRSGERRVLLTGGSNAHYLPTGHLVYTVGGSLYAVRFDLARLAVVGSGTPVIEGVRRGLFPEAQYDVSETGSLIYLSGPVGTLDQIFDQNFVLAEVDRSGQVNLVKLAPGIFCCPRYSPDGRQVVIQLGPLQRPQIGILDLSGTEAIRPLTLSGSNWFPIWSPDGSRVTFQSDREGDLGLFWQRADGTGPAERLTTPEPGTAHEPDAWSPDGQTLLFDEVKDPGSRDNSTARSTFSLWTLSLRDRKVGRFGSIESHRPSNATFAPNGHWVAYSTGEGDASRVYVEPYPRSGDRHLVTTNEPARAPFWSPNGKELFYASDLDRFRTVTFSTQPAVTFGQRVLVPASGLIGANGEWFRRDYDLSPDGKRIIGTIAAQTTRDALAPTIQVVLNWAEELKTKVP